MNIRNLFPRISTVLTLVFVLCYSVQITLASSETAIVAGGCFWCVESDFDSVHGVIETISGFTGGHVKDPTYKQVTRGGTGHYEAVKIVYDPDIVTYRELIDLFFRSIDPTDANGQFCDRGDAYRTALFVSNEEQKKVAEIAKVDTQITLGQSIVTKILNIGDFYPAEDYHQNYYKGANLVLTRFGIIKQSDAYERYRMGCGRDSQVKQLWGDEAIFAH